MGSWEPINENHAIDVMGVVIRFADALPDLLYRRALKSAASVAAELGLSSIGASQKMRFKFGNEGITQSEPFAPGQLFSRRVPIHEDPAEPFKAVEQLQVENDAIFYRTWDYVSWEWHVERMKILLSPVLGVIGEIVVFEAIGAEYVDKFRFVGDGEKPQLDLLLKRDSKLIAEHVFDAPSLFHSHTGSFINEDVRSPVLQVVKVDATDEEGSRWVHISTNQEYRYPPDTEKNADPFAILEQTHTDLKGLLAMIITDDQAKRIYLQG